MGAVFRPEDVLRNKKRLLKAVRDLAPGQVEQVEEILRRWREGSEQELEKLLGRKRAARLLSELR